MLRPEVTWLLVVACAVGIRVPRSHARTRHLADSVWGRRLLRAVPLAGTCGISHTVLHSPSSIRVQATRTTGAPAPNPRTRGPNYEPATGSGFPFFRLLLLASHMPGDKAPAVAVPFPFALALSCLLALHTAVFSFEVLFAQTWLGPE